MKNFIKGKIGMIGIQLFLIVYAIIQIYPLIWMVMFSLKDNNEIYGGNIAGLPNPPKWQNYTNAITQANILKYFFNSAFVTGATIIAVIILASMTSYAISRMKWKLSNVTLIAFLLGMMVPVHAALLPLFIILKNINLYNTYLSLIIPYTAFGLPMAIILFCSFMKGIPRELEEAAAIDGCSIYRIFSVIVLPLIRPSIATVAIFTYLASWNELMFAITFISKEQLKTITVGIMSMVGTYVTEWGPIGAGLVIATLPTVLIYILLSEQVQKSLVAGAVKG